MSRKSKGGSKKKKVLFILLPILVLVVTLVAYFWSNSQNSVADNNEKPPYTLAEVTEGSIASSTLLSGTVKALNEQYVYYDPSKGEVASFDVAVGNTVEPGQKLLQYDTTEAQAQYDQAVRALNKVGRQIEEVRTGAASAQALEGEEGAVSGKSVDSQLNDLYDAYADAQAVVNKAQEALNQTIIISDVSGTVVEVNTSVNPSKQGGQVLIHIVSEGQLQVEGNLTEYDLANIKVDQDVKITSKVYPDQSFTGKINYVSNYPTETASGVGEQSSNSSTYPFKVNFTSNADSLKQGFKVSIEVVNNEKNKLVPVTAIVTEKDKNYVWVYDKDTSKISKVEVTIGKADAIYQEVTGGIEVGQVVVDFPWDDFKDGQTIDGDIAVPYDDEVEEKPSE
ncbi:efflux RND transporter periplasmic adaptor subunit [Streptococcus zalophi]|uniref:Efflux RND transporter periplasmic adaptor subunit n=1 Tax=Streptococcus zalophi TaxID=640031 RepID=A0A934UD34_9STRE|nr:efflux RND transporter periplasmic adaptor subunit [Streptococcus zalophi]MBJ8349365.1 efflux RND transporter periplasmic adaptor subunit [Streptococcus zalophi]MCR8967440.1 efflux RND transporter periplasmic adaptor subunit [Streptococcus zalophi]